MTRRPLPCNIDAERAILGAILLRQSSLVEVATIVAAEDFYHPTHGAIYEAMVNLDGAGKPIHAVSLVEEMRARDTIGKLRAHGDEAYFVELTSAVATLENLSYLAKLVRAKKSRRDWLIALAEMAAEIGGDGDDDEVLATGEKRVGELLLRSRPAGYRPIHDAIRGVYKAVEQRCENRGRLTGVPSGHAGIDAITNGFQAGHFVILAARAKVGKTSAAMGIVAAASAPHPRFNGVPHDPIPSLIFSFEMSSAELAERSVSSQGRIRNSLMRTGQLESNDWLHFTKAATRLAEAPISLYDRAATLSEIRAQALRWRARETDPKKLGLVVVDYLQLITPEQSKRRSGNREQEVAEISRGLKSLARELRVPVLCLAQLNREAEKRKDKRPQRSDLRESGSLEQDADYVILIHRDDAYDREAPNKGEAELIIAANRHGATETVKVRFEGEYTLFSDFAA